ERVVYFGPQAQAILRPYLDAAGDGFLFSPRRAEEARNEKKREGRKTPRWPSHVRVHAARARTRKRPALHEHYPVASYRRAVGRACKAAGVPIWSPVQLRHNAGTAVRARFGLEVSQAVLGHAELGTTQIYAEKHREAARRAMTEMG